MNENLRRAVFETFLSVGDRDYATRKTEVFMQKLEISIFEELKRLSKEMFDSDLEKVF